MTQDDYAEAWAWVHFLMESRPECLELLRGYLAELRRDGAATPLSARLARRLRHGPGMPCLEHVAHLDGKGTIAVAEGTPSRSAVDWEVSSRGAMIGMPYTGSI